MRQYHTPAMRPVPEELQCSIQYNWEMRHAMLEARCRRDGIKIKKFKPKLTRDMFTGIPL